MKVKSVVLDANIWFSYIISGGFYTLANLILDSNLIFFRCEKLLNELRDVLSRPKHSKKIKLHQIETYIMVIKEVTKDVKISIVFKKCKDIKDNYLFDLAIQSNADILVSKDNEVLTTEIMPPPQLMHYNDFKMQYFYPHFLNDTKKPQEKGFLAWLKQDLTKFTDRNKK